MTTALTLCLALLALCFWRLYSNWSKLNHIPGPSLAGLSDYWRAWYQRRGELRGKLIELHEQYGPVVRYGVRSVSVNDPSAVDVIYGSRAGFVIVSYPIDEWGELKGNRERCGRHPLSQSDVLTAHPGRFLLRNQRCDPTRRRRQLDHSLRRTATQHPPPLDRERFHRENNSRLRAAHRRHD